MNEDFNLIKTLPILRMCWSIIKGKFNSTLCSSKFAGIISIPVKQVFWIIRYISFWSSNNVVANVSSYTKSISGTKPNDVVKVACTSSSATKTFNP